MAKYKSKYRCLEAIQLNSFEQADAMLDNFTSEIIRMDNSIFGFKHLPLIKVQWPGKEKPPVLSQNKIYTVKDIDSNIIYQEFRIGDYLVREMVEPDNYVYLYVIEKSLFEFLFELL